MSSNLAATALYRLANHLEEAALNGNEVRCRSLIQALSQAGEDFFEHVQDFIDHS